MSLKGSTVLIDIGSKYTQIDQFLQDADWEPAAKICFRPLLGAYDEKYVMDHPLPPDWTMVKDRSGNNLKMDKVQATLLLEWLEHPSRSDWTVGILANDSCYYPGVIEGINFLVT